MDNVSDSYQLVLFLPKFPLALRISRSDRLNCRGILASLTSVKLISQLTITPSVTDVALAIHVLEILFAAGPPLAGGRCPINFWSLFGQYRSKLTFSVVH